jgi:hypothetical protein
MDYNINASKNRVEFYDENGNLFFVQPKNPATGFAWTGLNAMIAWADGQVLRVEEKEAQALAETEDLEAQDQ